LLSAERILRIINVTVSSTVTLGQKIPGFEAGRKSAYLLFPKRGKREERERERERERKRGKRTRT